MTNETPATVDYNAKLAQDLSDIGGKVKRGMLPLEPRRAALDDATSRYALAQADHYASTPRAMPIALRNAKLLDRAADAMLYEDLRWSHPDKMSIVEFPIMSDRQAETRRAKQLPLAELEYGDMRGYGRRKVVADDESDTDGDRAAVHKRRVIPPTDRHAGRVEIATDVRRALDGAGLTQRQRQAITLVYFERMTQEEAARVMGCRRWTVNEHLADALAKLYDFMTKD